MQRVRRSTAVAVQPAEPSGLGAPGFFTGGNPASGQGATVPGFEWFNMVQEELVALVLRAGLTLDPADQAQVRKAIERLAGAGVRWVSSSITLTADDAGLIFVDATTGSRTITLPAANAMGGRPLRFTFLHWSGSANTVTVQRAGTDLIDGATSVVMQFGGRQEFVSDGIAVWGRTLPTFTAVQQGGGASQGTNKLYIGWDAAFAALRLQVDGTDYGLTWPINVTGRALSNPADLRGLFRNLVVTNGATPNTQARVTADAVALFDATNNAGLVATGIDITASTAASGVGGLDTGTVAANTWYNVWAIWNGTTLAALLSTSATAPIMPAGYTHRARLGAMRTDASGLLHRTRQVGRRAGYVVTPSSPTTALPGVTSGTVGSISTPTWVAASVASLVPPTASVIHLAAASGNAANSGAIAAPNANYGPPASISNPPPLSVGIGTGGAAHVLHGSFVLEGSTIQVACSGGSAILCQGWEDNL